MKVLICLCLILSFSNVMAKTMFGTSGSESFSQKNQGGDSGDLYSTGGDGGGDKSISGQDYGERSKHGGEGGVDGKTI
jgi:hypothetical protein